MSRRRLGRRLELAAAAGAVLVGAVAIVNGLTVLAFINGWTLGVCVGLLALGRDS